MKKRMLSLEKENLFLKKQLEIYDKRIHNLDKKYETKVTSVVEKGADYRSEINQLQLEINRINGKFEEIEFLLKNLKKTIKKISEIIDQKLNVTVMSIPEYVPKDKDKLFEFATAKLAAGDAKFARALFRKFIELYPKDKLADDAQFMIGETFFYEKKYTDAYRAYKVVHDKYRKSNKLEDALLRIGECFENIGNCKNALKIYEYAKNLIKTKKNKMELKRRIKKLKKLCK